eukprot:gene11665-24435_t
MSDFISKNINTGKELIVRVKRKRNTNPVDSLVVEDDSSRKRVSTSYLSKQLDALSTNDQLQQSTIGRKQLLLHRVSTELHQNNAANNADEHALQLVKKFRTDYNDNASAFKTSSESISPIDNSIWTTTSKKILNPDNSSSFLLVDISQHTIKDIPKLTENDTTSPKKKATKIITPITKQLDEAIENTYLTGDFTTIFDIIRQGADINYQRTAHDGLSLLMLAAYLKNTQAVSTLLTKGANPLLQDTNAHSALNYATEGISNKNKSNEIIYLIQNAIQSIEQKEQQKLLELQMSNESDLNEEYMIDIFSTIIPNNNNHHQQIESSIQSNESTSKNTLAPTSTSDESSSCTSTTTNTMQLSNNLLFHIPVVKVSGLQINETGTVDIAFEYDSDWSDLGDDEDPDSNDERFYGRVLHPSYIGSDRTSGNSSSRNTEDIVTQLWGFGNANGNGNDGDDEPDMYDGGSGDGPPMFNHSNNANSTSNSTVDNERLEDMALRTGMDIRSAAREFHSSGLPKFGEDLSEDDDDNNGYSHFGYDASDFIPSKDTVAFDADLDGCVSDDENI